MKDNRTFRLLFFLAVTSLFMACGSDSNGEVEESTEVTWEDVEKEFSELALVEGVNDFSLKVQNNQLWRIRAIVPSISNDGLKPLFVHLHGASGGNSDAHKSTDCYLEPALENLDAYVISPNGGVNLWHEAVNQVQVLALTDFAKKYWNVDPNKIVVVGYSNGGNGSWFFAETQPELFSAAIPMASSYSTFDTNGSPRKIKTPLYVIHGENDELFPLSDTQNWVESSVQAGSEIEFIVAPGLTHNEPCNYIDYLKEGIAWLQSSVWQ